MTITENYIGFGEFCKNEFATLAFLQSRKNLLKEFNSLAIAINGSYYQYLSADKQDNFRDFTFHCEFDMEFERDIHTVIIGSNVQNDFSECSYFLAIKGKEENKDKLIRKFHFDYAKPCISTKQKVPTYHCQYGGKLSPQMRDGGISDERLDSWLSLPRLNFYPVNLAILLDMLFCEFWSEETKKIVEDIHWRAHILKNERLLTVNYLNNLHQHINSAHYNKGKLIRDFFYGS